VPIKYPAIAAKQSSCQWHDVILSKGDRRTDKWANQNHDSHDLKMALSFIHHGYL